MPTTVLEEIKGNWESEHCIKPEHVEWLIDQVDSKGDNK